MAGNELEQLNLGDTVKPIESALHGEEYFQETIPGGQSSEKNEKTIKSVSLVSAEELLGLKETSKPERLEQQPPVVAPKEAGSEVASTRPLQKQSEAAKGFPDIQLAKDAAPVRGTEQRAEAAPVADKPKGLEITRAADGSETRTREDPNGKKVTLIKNADGVPTYLKDSQGEWTSQNGQNWTNKEGRTWAGKPDIKDNGDYTYTMDKSKMSVTEQADGSEVRTRKDAKGNEVTVKRDSKGVATYVKDETGEWTSKDGKNWEKDNGPGKEKGKWSGEVNLKLNGDYSQKEANGKTETLRHADGSETRTSKDDKGTERTVKKNKDGVATYLKDESGEWTSKNGKDWEKDNGPNKEKSKWQGTAELKRNGEYVETGGQSGRIETRHQDGSKTVNLSDKTSYREKDGEITLYDASGAEVGKFVDAAKVEDTLPQEPGESEPSGMKNGSDKPILVLANTLDSEGKKTGMGFHVLKPGESTPAGSDADAVVTDPRFQPRVVDGRTLVPASLPVDAKVYKISGNQFAEITEKDGVPHVDRIKYAAGIAPSDGWNIINPAAWYTGLRTDSGWLLKTGKDTAGGMNGNTEIKPVPKRR